LRSQKEIEERLKRKGFEEKLIKETVGFLKEKHFIDDEIFAKNWIEWRLRNSLGIRKIRQELRAKGVPQAVIDNKVQEIGPGFPEEEIVSTIARERFIKLKDIEPNSAKRRIYAYLLRRGFSPDTVIEAINRL
jgi:regulatory protein